MNIERWKVLLSALGASLEAETFFRLQAAYAERHRRYHTSRHIDECLSLFDEVKYLAEYPAEVECALWFHDAVYKPMAKSNEVQSANWLEQFGRAVGMQPQVVARIRAHIMATCHLASAAGDSGLVVDIDLAILGAATSRYDEFERDVRQEYRWIPRFIYNPKRVAILRSFLDRPHIYHWQPMRDRFEYHARANIARAVHALMSAGGAAA